MTTEKYYKTKHALQMVEGLGDSDRALIRYLRESIAYLKVSPDSKIELRDMKSYLKGLEQNIRHREKFLKTIRKGI